MMDIELKVNSYYKIINKNCEYIVHISEDGWNAKWRKYKFNGMTRFEEWRGNEYSKLSELQHIIEEDSVNNVNNYSIEEMTESDVVLELL